MIKPANRKTGAAVTLSVIIGILSWVMIPITFITVVMTFMSTFNIFVTALFDSARTLITVLFITCLIWTFRSIMDSGRYPTYRVYSVGFAVLTVIAGYLLRVGVF